MDAPPTLEAFVKRLLVPAFRGEGSFSLPYPIGPLQVDHFGGAGFRLGLAAMDPESCHVSQARSG